MSSPRIAIATCADYADLKVDDGLLRQALEERGCEAREVIWNEPGIEWRHFDLCLVRSTWDYHERHAEYLAWAGRVEVESRLLNPAEVLIWNSDKRYLRELGERGLRTIPTVWVGRDSPLNLEQILAGAGWEEAVVKPVVDLGARNLRRVRAGEGSAALESILQHRDAMVQPFLPSVEERGETSLVYIGGELSHTVRKRPAAGDFRVQSIWGGTVSLAEPTLAERDLAEAALAEFKEAPLYARVDLVEGPTLDPCLIELELIEPNLYLCEHAPAAEALADAVLHTLD
jgi:glutathione synthase/RimK-type ligase-like ATP-grasp enzyme